MKIRNPKVLKLLAWVGAWIVRVWMASIRYRWHCLGAEVVPPPDDDSAKYIYTFWHENILQPAYRYRNLGIGVLISQHADGQLIADICDHLGFRAIRGSTTRGGAEAVRHMLRFGRQASLAITPDGPRGPRRQVQMGLIYLASALGLHIVPIGFGADLPWRLKSWDRFVLPRPFSRGRCVAGEPIFVPPGLDRDGMEHFRLVVDKAIADVSDLAETWAESGDRTLLLPAVTGRKWERSARRAAG